LCHHPRPKTAVGPGAGGEEKGRDVVATERERTPARREQVAHRTLPTSGDPLIWAGEKKGGKGLRHRSWAGKDEGRARGVTGGRSSDKAPAAGGGKGGKERSYPADRKGEKKKIYRVTP